MNFAGGDEQSNVLSAGILPKGRYNFRGLGKSAKLEV